MVNSYLNRNKTQHRITGERGAMTWERGRDTSQIKQGLSEEEALYPALRWTPDTISDRDDDLQAEKVSMLHK